MIVSVDIGYRHLAWVVFQPDPLRYVDGGVDDILHKKKPTTESVTKGLTHWIRHGPLTKYPDATIVCESQVGPAVKNRVLAFVLLSHWTPRPFHFVTSSTKVKKMPLQYFPASVDPATILQQNYAKRKQASVLMTRHICAQCDMAAACSLMETLSKKDDFADAFVQGFYFCLVRVL